MTQEEKELLLKDLCARFPYGVKVHINSPIEEQNSMELFDVNFESEHIGVGNKKWVFRAIPIIDDEDKAEVIKPYLRPMSSMTEKEKKEYRKTQINKWIKCVDCTGGGYYVHRDTLETFDWLNAHHFDYRNLIEKGLALEAPEGMYEY